MVKLAANNGYTMITSAGWYLGDANTSLYYDVEPCTGISDALCRTQVLGGGGALWQQPPGTVMTSVFPNVAAIAERLWSNRNATASFDAAKPRLAQFHCHLGAMGVPTGPLDGPEQAFGSCAA